MTRTIPWPKHQRFLSENNTQSLFAFQRLKPWKTRIKIRLRVLYDKDKGKEVTVVFKNKEKYTKILRRNSFSTSHQQGRPFQKWNTANLKTASGKILIRTTHSDTRYGRQECIIVYYEKFIPMKWQIFNYGNYRWTWKRRN